MLDGMIYEIRQSQNAHKLSTLKKRKKKKRTDMKSRK